MSDPGTTEPRHYGHPEHTGTTEAISEATRARRLLSDRKRSVQPHTTLDSAAERGEPLLKLSDLEVYYGAIQALRGVSAALHPGEIVTIIGSNGAGKSTTLKTISSLLRPRVGEVYYEGQAISHLQPEEVVARGIVHVPEGRRIFANLTVAENLDLGAYLRKDKDKIAKDRAFVLEMFPRLAERRKQRGGTLSGGEQQMLAIARGLMANPKVLMLDEPSLGLAPVLVQQIFADITRLNQERKLTILLVEQNAAQALRIAHRAYVIETGSIALEGPARQLAKDPAIRAAYLGSA